MPYIVTIEPNTSYEFTVEAYDTMSNPVTLTFVSFALSEEAALHDFASNYGQQFDTGNPYDGYSVASYTYKTIVKFLATHI